MSGVNSRKTMSLSRASLRVYMILSKMETPGSKEVITTGLGGIHQTHSDLRTVGSTKRGEKKTNKNLKPIKAKFIF